MNILFITIGNLSKVNQHGLYSDLVRCFRDKGNKVYVVTHHQRKEKLHTELHDDDGVNVLSVKIGNITKCGLIEKGISTLLIEYQYRCAIKKYFKGIKFDLVIYTTPPITLYSAVKYIKKRDNSKTYLLLKDIFPQNAVDLGILSKHNIKGLIYRWFRHKEKLLYKISDYIGCMSFANVEYIKRENPFLEDKIVEVCPNSVQPRDIKLTDSESESILKSLNISPNQKIFVYGGNLGKPQGIDFVIKAIKSQKNNNHVCFLIIGSGTEYNLLESEIGNGKQNNVRIIKSLPKDEYDKVLKVCDVGMIFLDSRFTIPNFPSRILSYMQAKIPVLLATDTNSDQGKIVCENGFGWWSKSDDIKAFSANVALAISSDCKSMGAKAYDYLIENYTVNKAYDIIFRHFN